MSIISNFPVGGGGGAAGGPPTFTYTGTYSLLDDGGKNWRIKFLASGTLTITSSNVTVDVFLVGGGGASAIWAGGGAGGYTATYSSVVLETGVPYSIVIGAGGIGASASDGGKSWALTESMHFANGGGASAPSSGSGGNGGSGGAGYAGLPGTDGGNGTPSTGQYHGGTGQGTTTREFGEAAGTLYATGGYMDNGDPGAYNTGNGGNSIKAQSSNGGSGIVILRNHRRAAA